MKKREEHMEDDKLRSYLQKLFYNYKADANDLEWKEIENHLKSNSALGAYFSGADQIKWISKAASILLIVALFAYNIYNDKNEEMSANLPAISENTDTPEPKVPNKENFETIPPSQNTTTKEPESDKALISELTQLHKSIKQMDNDSGDNLARIQGKDIAFLADIGEDSFNDINSVKSEIPRFEDSGIGGNAPVDLKPYSQDFNSENNRFLAVRNEDTFLTMNRLSFSIRPVQKYSSFTPNRNDIVYIQGLNSVSPVSEERLGIHASFSARFNLNTKWNLVMGASYLHQNNYFEYESLNLWTSQLNQFEINSASNHVGVSAGMERTIPFLTSYNPEVHFNVEYLIGISAEENALGDILSVDVGYSVTLMEANMVEFRIKPIISYSFFETKNPQFSSKPYWVGIQFTVNRKL